MRDRTVRIIGWPRALFDRGPSDIPGYPSIVLLVRVMIVITLGLLYYNDCYYYDHDSGSSHSPSYDIYISSGDSLGLHSVFGLTCGVYGVY